ncbi:hypothetical protein JZ751_016827 [Albula glossodonta]|uniref:Uncharacterized protein n=1 Tax=Albula glossodonta TaxID=121402 RepID=A0A8T2NPN7_9TELE|nr:hypothetical protein JZ751_016827 [Albula glossodonta]
MSWIQRCTMWSLKSSLPQPCLKGMQSSLATLLYRHLTPQDSSNTAQKPLASLRILCTTHAACNRARGPQRPIRTDYLHRPATGTIHHGNLDRRCAACGLPSSATHPSSLLAANFGDPKRYVHEPQASSDIEKVNPQITSNGQFKRISSYRVGILTAETPDPQTTLRTYHGRHGCLFPQHHVPHGGDLARSPDEVKSVYQLGHGRLSNSLSLVNWVVQRQRRRKRRSQDVDSSDPLCLHNQRGRCTTLQKEEQQQPQDPGPELPEQTHAVSKETITVTSDDPFNVVQPPGGPGSPRSLSLLVFTILQMIPAVDENAADISGLDARVVLPQCKYEAAHARVGAGRENVRHLQTAGHGAMQLLHQVPHCHTHVCPVTNHQGVDGKVPDTISRVTSKEFLHILHTGKHGGVTHHLRVGNFGQQVSQTVPRQGLVTAVQLESADGRCNTATGYHGGWAHGKAEI